MNKTVKVSFRITEDESVYIQKLAMDSGKSTSEIIRQLIKNAREDKTVTFEPKEHFLLNKQLVYEINRIGNNINQIAKNNNAHYYTPNEKQKLMEMMEEIERLLE